MAALRYASLMAFSEQMSSRKPRVRIASRRVMRVFDIVSREGMEKRKVESKELISEYTMYENWLKWRENEPVVAPPTEGGASAGPFPPAAAGRNASLRMDIALPRRGRFPEVRRFMYILDDEWDAWGDKLLEESGILDEEFAPRQLFDCDGHCGFRASDDEVSVHEMTEHFRALHASLLQAAVRSKIVRQSCYTSVQADRSPPSPKVPSWRRHTPSPTSSTASAAPTASPCCLFSPSPAITSPLQPGAFAITPPPFTPLPLPTFARPASAATGTGGTLCARAGRFPPT